MPAVIYALRATAHGLDWLAFRAYGVAGRLVVRHNRRGDWSGQSWLP